MDKIKLFVGIALCSFLFSANAQVTYYDAALFPLIGKISENTETRYERLPKNLKGSCREPVWNLGKNTSGLALRFKTNSTAIYAKWEVFGNHMNHMTDTGTKGLDLYAWEDGRWQFVNSGRPQGKMNEQKIIANMLPCEREYMLFLPLYDGIMSLSVGIDSLSRIGQPDLSNFQTGHPIIVYGTSITQGGCASRPGMSYPNILDRELNREFINLGFSGNGKLDYEIAELMATRHDASLFILDFIPNVTAEEIKEKTKTFFQILRRDNPNTPVLFIETAIFPHSVFDKSTYGLLVEKNRLLRQE